MRQHELPSPALPPHQGPGQQGALGAQKCHFEGRTAHFGVRHGLKCWHWRESALCKSVCACEVSGSAVQILSAASVISSRVTVWWQCSGFWSPSMARRHKTPLCHHCCGTQWAECPPKQLLRNRPTQNVIFLTHDTLFPFHIFKSKNLGKPLQVLTFSLQVTAS